MAAESAWGTGSITKSVYRAAGDDEPRKEKEPASARTGLAASAPTMVDPKDIEHWTTEFRKIHTEVSEKMKKCNVLLAGASGAGKSQLVNAVFGQQLAITGVGRPVTQHYQCYQDVQSDKHVVIYDCKGLEHGRSDEFIAETTNFLAERKFDPNEPEKGIHCVWYVINLADARLEDFHFELWEKVYKDQHIIVVFNKADLLPPADAHRIIKLVTDRQAKNELPMIKSIVTTVARTDVRMRRVDHCAKCGSDDISVKPKHRTMECDDCGHKESIAIEDGIQKLVDDTYSVLPDVIRRAFVGAQESNLHLKDTEARKIILEAIDRESVFSVRGFTELIVLLAHTTNLANTGDVLRGYISTQWYGATGIWDGLQSRCAAFMYFCKDWLQGWVTTTDNQIEILVVGICAYQTFRGYLEAEMKKTASVMELDPEKNVNKIFFAHYKVVHQFASENKVQATLDNFIPVGALDSKGYLVTPVRGESGFVEEAAPA